MDLTELTYCGPEVDDHKLLAALPFELREILGAVNGFVQFQGGLHIRGICSEPNWHSLEHALRGEQAMHAKYESIDVEDVPFGQDCVGDQFLLRAGEVMRLSAETDQVDFFAASLSSFLKAANESPVEYLSLEPLLQLHNEGGFLKPGELIQVYPPFCTKEAANGVSLRAVPVDKLLGFHADFANKLPRDGSAVNIKIVD